MAKKSETQKRTIKDLTQPELATLYGVTAHRMVYWRNKGHDMYNFKKFWKVMHPDKPCPPLKVPPAIAGSRADILAKQKQAREDKKKREATPAQGIDPDNLSNDPDTLKATKLKADTVFAIIRGDKIRHELAITKREYIPVDEVGRVMEVALIRLKTRLEALPTLLCNELVGLSTNKIKKSLQTSIYEVLKDLAANLKLDDDNNE